MSIMRSMASVACGAMLSLLAAPGAVYGDDDDEGVRCRATLDEAAEVPAPDPVFGTEGRARLDFEPEPARAHYRLRVDDGQRLFMAHIHCAAEGETGPIVLWLAGAPPPPTGWDVDGNWIRETTLDDEEVFDNIPGTGNNCRHEIADLGDLANACLAGDCYVNIHSRDNPAGQIRGQLRCRQEDDD